MNIQKSTTPTTARTPRETVEWYVKHLNMKFVLAIAEDQVPSTHAPDLHMAPVPRRWQGNVLAFEILNSPPMGGPNTPDLGAVHRVRGGTAETLEETKVWPEARASWSLVKGPITTIFKSRSISSTPKWTPLELAANTGTPDMYRKLDDEVGDAGGGNRRPNAHRHARLDAREGIQLKGQRRARWVRV